MTIIFYPGTTTEAMHELRVAINEILEVVHPPAHCTGRAYFKLDEEAWKRERNRYLRTAADVFLLARGASQESIKMNWPSGELWQLLPIERLVGCFVRATSTWEWDSAALTDLQLSEAVLNRRMSG